MSDKPIRSEENKTSENGPEPGGPDFQLLFGTGAYLTDMAFRYGSECTEVPCLVFSEVSVLLLEICQSCFWRFAGNVFCLHKDMSPTVINIELHKDTSPTVRWYY